MSENTENTNSVPSKAEAKFDQAVGSAKETVGNALGNAELQSEGAAQHGQGQVKETTNNVAEFFKKVNNDVKGTVKGLFSAFSGNSSEKK